MPDVWNHEPADYACPFCLLQQGVHSERNAAEDVVGVTPLAFARISPTWWPDNHGAALVIPRAHHENLYDLPREVGHGLADLVQAVAVAMRASYDCEGVSTRQHNEPAGGQDVWHVHVHVFPRYTGDRLYERQREARPASPDERKPYADRLAAELGMPRTFG
jgi:histidine triad (HIT) family protein